MKQDHLRQARDIGQDTLQDRPQDALDRISVAQAATRLGITQDAVRKRIARGTIRHGKDHEGRTFVYLDTFENTFESESETDQDNGQGAESKTVLDDDQDKYTRSLEDQIEFLRRELERKDTIIMSLTQRIPELEASSEPRETPERSSEDTDNTVWPKVQRSPQNGDRGGGRSSGWSEPKSSALPANAGETEGLPSQRPSGGPLRFLLSPRALPL